MSMKPSEHPVLFGIAGLTIVIVAGIAGYVAIQNHKIDAEINAQTVIEQTEIEEKAATQRTRERMHWLPWYGDDENTEITNE